MVIISLQQSMKQNQFRQFLFQFQWAPELQNYIKFWIYVVTTFNPIRDGGCSPPHLPKISSKTLKNASKWLQILRLFLFLYDLQ